MARCDNCGKERPETRKLLFWTARIAGQRTDYVSYKKMRITTSYTNFQHHSYQVCRRCNQNKRWLPIIGAIVSFFLLVVPMGMMNRAGVPSMISTPIMLVVVTALVIGGVTAARAWKPTKLALAERKTFDPKGKYSILSEKEYAALSGSQLPKV
jgi:hypothetical protein